MILDVKIAGHYKYELFDADGNKLQYVLWADTESGAIIRCSLTDDDKLQKDHNNDIMVETTTVPAPLKYLEQN